MCGKPTCSWFWVLGYLEGLSVACSDNPSDLSQFYVCILFNYFSFSVINQEKECLNINGLDTK